MFVLYTCGEGVENTDIQGLSTGPDWHLPQLSWRRGAWIVFSSMMVACSTNCYGRAAQQQATLTLAAGISNFILHDDNQTW
jgi:hypothetical protein